MSKRSNEQIQNNTIQNEEEFNKKKKIGEMHVVDEKGLKECDIIFRGDVFLLAHSPRVIDYSEKTIIEPHPSYFIGYESKQATVNCCVSSNPEEHHGMPEIRSWASDQMKNLPFYIREEIPSDIFIGVMEDEIVRCTYLYKDTKYKLELRCRQKGYR